MRISIEEGVEVRFSSLRSFAVADSDTTQYALTGSSKSLTKLSSLLSSPLIIMSRHYRPFCHKDGAIILFAESGPGIESISLARFLEGHISPGLNEGMGVGKFVSRFELGLSTTVRSLYRLLVYTLKVNLDSHARFRKKSNHSRSRTFLLPRSHHAPSSLLAPQLTRIRNDRTS